MREKLATIFLVCAVVVLVIGFMQTFNVFNINEFTTRYFKPEYAERVTIDPETRLLGIQRIPSTFYNPNIFGLFLLIPLSMSLALALLKKKWLYIVLSIIFFAGILITQSRTVAVCCVFILPIMLLIIKKRSGSIFKRGIVVAACIIIIGFFLGTYIVNELNLLRVTQIGISEGSVQVRIDVLAENIPMIMEESPLFGYSPLSYPKSALDNEYLWFLYYTGTIGVMLYIIFVYLIHRAIPKEIDYISIAVTTVLFLYILANFALTTFYAEKVYVPFMISYGLAVSGLPRESKPMIHENNAI